MGHPFSFPTQTDASGSVDPANVVPGTLTDVNLAGTYSLGGTPSLAADIDANGNTITDLGAPTPASTEAATAAYAETVAASSKTGSEVTLATLGASGGTWFVNQYVGPDSFVVGTSGTATNITPWPAPCPGLLKNFRVQGQSATTGITTLTGYKSSGGNTLSYSSTAAVIVVANGDKSGSDTSNTVAVAAGDLWLFRSDTEWATGWGKITAQFIPTSA